MRPHLFLTVCIVLALTIGLSGCTSLIPGDVDYVRARQSVQIRYTLRYGYYVNITSTGRYVVRCLQRPA